MRTFDFPLPPRAPLSADTEWVQPGAPGAVPVCSPGCHLGLGDGWGIFIYFLVNFIDFVLLGLQFLVVGVHDELVQPFHLLLHLRGFLGHALVICPWKRGVEGIVPPLELLRNISSEGIKWWKWFQIEALHICSVLWQMMSLTVTKSKSTHFFVPLLYRSSPAVKTTQHGLVKEHRVLKHMRWCIRRCSKLILCISFMGRCSKVKLLRTGQQHFPGVGVTVVPAPTEEHHCTEGMCSHREHRDLFYRPMAESA